MAKIKKKVQRRANYPPHEIRELKHALEKGTERDIIENVARLEEWKFVRGDFYHWVPTLDRFDEILERVCTEYELKSLQRRPFAPETAQLVKAILDFTLLLLENCVNRNLYSSIDRLEQLINTTDIEVLEKVLCVLLRGFQRWNAQRDQRSMYQAFLPKLKCLSQPWYVTKYMRWNDVQGEIDISKQGEVYQMLFRAGNLSFHSDATSITYQYYRTPFDAEAGSAGTTHQQPGVVSEDQHQHQGGSAETPRHRLLRGAKQASGVKRVPVDLSGPPPLDLPEEGLVTIDVPASQWKKYSEPDLLDRISRYYGITEQNRYELWHRVKIAQAIAAGDLDTLFRCRIMALAVLATVVNDKEFRMIAVSFEPQLVPELVAAFRPETRAPVRTQICVLQCIDSLIRRRDQIAELYSSLNVSANHGVLMYVLRRAFAPSDHGRLPLPSTTTDSSVVRADSGAGMAKYPRQFLDSLQALIMSMTPWHNSSQLLVSAGAVDLLVSVLRHDSVADVTDVIRAVRLLHTIIISSPTSGFNAFASSEGVALLVKRMKLEVDRSIEEDSRALYDIDAKALPYPLAVYPLTSDTQFKAPEVLSASQITILKALFKLLHHLVQQPSYHDHLRNLIESSLPQTIENVIKHPRCFGTHIYGMAIKIMARLIHNEPTSLSILQEDTLPSTFLRQLGEFIPYSMDTLIAIPNALGALCLNQVGYDQVMKSNVASKLFETITQIEYVKILQEGDGMCELGMELDEFMRHFSSARPAIMDLVVKYLQNIVELGTERPDKITAYNPGFSSMYASQEEYANKAAREDLYGLMIDSSTLFLDGMLGQDFHAKEAAESGAWEAIIAMLRSPLLALNFEGSTRIFEVFINLSRMILKASEKGTEVLVKELKRTLANEEFTEKCLSTESSLLVAYANPGDFPAESAKIHDTYLHQINVATCLVSLLAGYEDTPYDMSSSTAAQNYRTTASYLTRSEYYELVPRILKMYRAIVKEDILLHHREEAIKKLVSEKPSDDAGIPPEYVRENLKTLSKLTKVFRNRMSSFLTGFLEHMSKPPTTANSGKHRLVFSYISNFVIDCVRMCAGLNLARGVTEIRKVQSLLSTITGVVMNSESYAYIYLPVLLPLLRNGGVDEILNLLRKLWASAEARWAQRGTSPGAEDKEEAELSKNLDSVVTTLLSQLNIFIEDESFYNSTNRSSLAMFLDDVPDSPGGAVPPPTITNYREALLERLRVKIVTVYISLWTTPALPYVPSKVLDSLIRGLSTLECHMHKSEARHGVKAGERYSQQAAAPSSSRGVHFSSEQLIGEQLTNFLRSRFAATGDASALLFTGQLPSSSAPDEPSFSVDQDRVDQLVQMGHPRSEAENALYHTSNDIANALRHLVTGTAGGTAPSSEGAAMDVDTATVRPLPPLPSSSGTQVSDSSIKILDQAERDKVKDALHMLQRQFFDTIPTSFLRVMESTLDENVLVLSEFMNRVVTNPDYCDSILTELTKASGFLANNFVSLIRSIVASGDCQDAMTTSAGGSLSAGTVNMAPVERISKLVGTHAYFWAASLDRMDEFNDLVKYCKGDLLSSYCDVIACVGDVPASKSWVSPCIVFVNTMFEADRIMLEKGSIMSSEEQGKIRARFENAGVNGKDTAIEGDVSDAVQPTPTNAPDSEAKALLPELALKGLLDTALYLLRINAKEAPDADMILAALGLLLHLTHDHGLTAEFCEKKGLEALFGVARLLDVAKANENDGEQEKKAEGDSKLTQLSLVKSQYLSQSRQLFTLIIRHCLESMRFLQCHIESLIYDWFQNAHYHGAHVFDFIERNHGIIYRNFDIFKDVTRRRCILPRCDSGATSGPNLLIAWRSEDLLTLKEVVEYEHGGPNPLHEKKRKRAQQQGEGEWADSTAKEGTQEEDNKPDLLRSIGDADPSLSCEIVHFIIDELLSLRPPSAKTASSQPAAGDIGPQPSATADTTATTPLRSASFIRATCKQQQQQQLHHHHQYQQAAQESPDVIAYRCLLLQCLAELFVSFPHSLAGVLVQRGGDTLAQSSESEPCPVKVGSPLVNHLIHSIIPREAAISAFPSPNYRQKLGDDATEEEKRTAQLKDQIDEHRRALASAQLFWSTTVLTTMCLRYAEGLKKDKEETKAGSSDNSQRPSPPHPRLGFAVPNYETTLSQARQVILDHLALAMRETLALMSGTSHPLDVVYLRLGAWVGLAYKLLTTKPIGKSYTMTAYKRDYDRKEMARMMLERGLLDLMVVALSQLDLNHPRHRAVLKPLYGSFDELVKLSAEMSADVVMNKSAKASSDKAIASYFSNPTLLEPDSSDVGDYTGVSATQSSLPPDLYRNSALGISAGNASAVETDFNYSEMGDDYPDDDDYYNNDDSSLSDMSMTDISGESGDGEEEMAEDEYATEDEDDELDEQGEMEMYDQRYRADDQDNEMDVDDGDVTSESELDPDEQGIGSEDEVDIHGSDAMDEGVEDAEEELMLGDEGHDDEMYWETDHSDVEANEAEGSRHHRRHYPHGIGESGTEFRDGGSFLDILARLHGTLSQGGRAEGDTSSGVITDTSQAADLLEDSNQAAGRDTGMTERQESATGEVANAAASLDGDEEDEDEAWEDLIDDADSIPSNRPRGRHRYGQHQHFTMRNFHHEIEGAEGPIHIDINVFTHPPPQPLPLARGGHMSGRHAVPRPSHHEDTLHQPQQSAIDTFDFTFDPRHGINPTEIFNAISNRLFGQHHRPAAGTSARIAQDHTTLDLIHPLIMDESKYDGSGTLARPSKQVEARTELEQTLYLLALAKSAITGYSPLTTAKRWELETKTTHLHTRIKNVRHIDHQIVNDLLPVSIEQRILRRRIVKEEARRIEEERKRKEEQEAEERRRREEEEAKTREKEERNRPAESTNAEQNEPMLIEDETVEAGPTRPSEPIIVRIGGEDVDIAGTGIDPEVLRELPEDIREEVYHQHLESINQSRSQATRQDDISGSGISREFLDALPDDIREEVLQQERLERIMRERQQQQQQASSSQAAAAGSGAAESPQAAQQSPRTSVSNIDRTAPQFTQQLPPLFSFSTLSGGISGEQPNPFSRLFGSWQPRTTPAPLGSSPYAGTQADGGGGGGGLVQRPPNVVGGRLRGPMDQQRPTVIFQLIDRTELAMVVRHLFLPNEEINITLYKTILQLLCLNPRTRLDLIFIMLALLQSNAMTFDALDSVIYQVMKSSMPGPSDHQQPSSSLFLKSPTSKISIIPKEPEAPAKGSSEGTRTEFVRPLPSILQVSPAATMPSRAHILKHVYPLAMLNYEVPIYYIATGAMNTLLFLVTKIPKAAGHFLVEQPSMAVAVADLLSSPALSRKLGRHASAKGKESAATPARGKDKLPAVTREVSKYPVVALLELLNNSQVYLEHSEPMEILVELLASVTKPLVVWSKKLTGEANKSKVAADTVSSATVTNEGNSGVGNAGEPSAAASSSSQPPSSDSGTVTASPKLPQIPEPALRTLANVLTADECSSKTFRNFLTLIGNFSVIPGVNDLVTEELLHRVSSLSVEVQQDLQQLLPLLQTSVKAEDESEDATSEVIVNKGDTTLEPEAIQSIVLTKFSQPSSHQSKLLRILKALDYIFTSIRKSAKPTSSGDQSGGGGDEQAASARMDIEGGNCGDQGLKSLSTGLMPLWDALGQCLKCTHNRPNLHHVATVMLPLIESFMVVFKSSISNTPSSLQRSSTSSSGIHGSQLPQPQSSSLGEQAESPPSSRAPAAMSAEAYFQSFTDAHKKVLNMLVRASPSLLSGSFSLLVHNPRVLDFDNKRSYFYQQLRKNDSQMARPQLKINVRRKYVFDDSYQQFAGKSGSEIRRGRLNVHFRGEEGVDVGGLTREWFQELSREMFNPDYALFKPSTGDKITYQPNSQSWANPDHLMYFKFVGRVIGKAICDERLFDAYFTRSFYKHILGRKVDYRDIEAIDPDYYKSLQWMLENDITDVVEETFSVEVDDFGQMRIIDLIPNGRKIPVTEENKHEYVRLVTEQRLTASIRDQINSFMTGFYELVPKELIQIFNEQELELLISGMPDIDVDDWRNNTEYHGGYNMSSAQIQWFWRAVRSFDQEERAKLLQFVTGTSKVPIGGFSKLRGSSGVQKFQIHRDFSSTNRLPTAHTCFNQLDLPMYESYETLRSQLLLAISECSTGFGFS